MPRARRSRRGGRASPPRMPRGTARRGLRRKAAGRRGRSRARAADWSFLLLHVAQVAVVVAAIRARLLVGVLGREHAIGFDVVGLGPWPGRRRPWRCARAPWRCRPRPRLALVRSSVVASSASALPLLSISAFWASTSALDFTAASVSLATLSFCARQSRSCSCVSKGVLGSGRRRCLLVGAMSGGREQRRQKKGGGGGTTKRRGNGMRKPWAEEESGRRQDDATTGSRIVTNSSAAVG